MSDLFSFDCIGQGILHDVQQRFIPHYAASIKDALNYRVIPATVYIFFTNLLPAIAFAQDMFDHTKNSYGINEILLSSAMGGVIFGGFSGSPLCIVGVTGPVSIFCYTVYELIVPRGTPYFQFMAWICLWSMVMHFILAFGNFINFMRFVTRFSCDVFGLFINIVYIQKGIQILSLQFKQNAQAGFASTVLALIMGLFGVAAIFFATKSHYSPYQFRSIIKDYSTPLCVVFFTGFIHFGGYLSDVQFDRLPITKAFHPTDLQNRSPSWFIYFWRDISVGDIFLAVPFALLLTILFYYDHNISSLMCHSNEFPLKKPVTFHYDFFLLGITTGLSGILGLPPPNGLIPQAPLHTMALCEHDSQMRIQRVIEQRLSNTIQGLMTIGMMTRPLLIVLGQIPRGVLAGLFWVMAIPALDGNGIINRMRFLCLDKDWRIHLSQKLPYSARELHNFCDDIEEYELLEQHVDHEVEVEGYPVDFFKVPYKVQLKFLACSLIAFGAEFAITCTKGAVGFPGVLMAILIFVKLFFKRLFGEYLQYLDGDVVDRNIAKGLWLVRKEPKT